MAFVEHLVETYGLIVVAGVILLESLGLPMPGETVLIVASIYAGTSHPHLYIIDVVLTAAGAGLVWTVAIAPSLPRSRCDDHWEGRPR